MRARFVNEKFKEQSDPIKDMGIGIYRPVRYKSPQRAAQFMIKHLATIIDVDEIPNNIVNKRTSSDDINEFNEEYWDPFVKFLKTNVLTIDGRRDMQFLVKVLHEIFKILRDKGYPKDVNEKFSEESDPIHDMGIGVMARLKKEYSILSNMNINEKPYYLFNERHAHYGAEIVEDILKKITSSNIPLSLGVIDEIMEKKDALSIVGKAMIRKYFKEKFDFPAANLDNVNEKFSEDSDPIKDLGIGTEGEIIKWLEGIVHGSFIEKSLQYSQALMYCAGYGKEDFVIYLLETNTLEYFKNNESVWLNALPWAAEQGHYNIVKILLDYGFDPTVLENYALRHAEQIHHEDVVKLLRADPRVIEEEKRYKEKYT